MANNNKQAYKFRGYTFHAKSLAAHFRFSNDCDDDFGPEFALGFHGRSPFKHKDRPGGHEHPEISFKHSWVHIVTRQERGVYTTVVKAGLKDLNVKGKLLAKEIEAGIMTVYREEWYADRARPRRARILPLRPAVEGLKICGEPYRLGKELILPEPLEYSDARRKAYFAGEGDEINPIDVSDTPGKREKLPCGEVAISKDTRRIEIPDFGIVNFAQWNWLPRDLHRHEQTAQRFQLIGLELRNPGSGGGGGVIGGGSPYGGGSH